MARSTSRYYCTASFIVAIIEKYTSHGHNSSYSEIQKKKKWKEWPVAREAIWRGEEDAGRNLYLFFLIASLSYVEEPHGDAGRVRKPHALLYSFFALCVTEVMPAFAEPIATSFIVRIETQRVRIHHWTMLSLVVYQLGSTLSSLAAVFVCCYTRAHIREGLVLIICSIPGEIRIYCRRSPTQHHFDPD